MQRAETAGIPQFVGKIPADFAFLVRILDIQPDRRDVNDREPQRVRAVLRDHIQRIGRVAQRFGELAPEAVAYDARKIDVAERMRSLELVSGHDHARHPEEDDIRSGHQVVGRVEEFLFRGLFRPTHDRERPQPGTEPGIQHIFFLTPPVAFRRIHAHIHFVGGIFVPRRDPVSPPDLTADAPVLNVLHPMEISLRPAFRIEFDRAVADRFDRGFGQFVHLDEPLVAQQRFDLDAAAFGKTYIVHYVFDLFHQSELFKFRHALFAAFITVQPRVFAADRIH